MIKKHHKNPIHILFSKKNPPLRKTYFYNIFTISNHYHINTKYIIGGNNVNTNTYLYTIIMHFLN